MVSSRFKIDKTLYESGISRIYLVSTNSEDRFALKINTSQFHAPLEHKVCTTISSNYFKDTGKYSSPSNIFRYAFPLLTGISYFSEQGTAVLMNYVKGVSLEAIMLPETFSLLVDTLKTTSDKLRLSLGFSAALQACKALTFLHKERSVDGVKTRFVHGDIKPSNMLLSVKGDIFLYDLGCCKPEKDLIIGEEIVVGTPEYLSPEQVLFKPRDIRADQFSLGVSLYELFTGKNPFNPGNRLDDLSVMQNIVHTDPISPSRYNDLILSRLENLVFKSLSKDPNGRFVDIQNLAYAIEELCGSGSKSFSKDIGAALCSLPYGSRCASKPPSSKNSKTLVRLLERMNEEFSIIKF